MKTIYLYVTPEGSINMIEGDKMPVKKDYVVKGFQDTFENEAYQQDLQAAIASSIPVQDHDRAKSLIAGQIEKINPGGSTTFLQLGAIYGPFTVEYQIQDFHYCKQCGAYKSIKLIPCQNAYCGKTTEKVAILPPDVEASHFPPFTKLGEQQPNTIATDSTVPISQEPQEDQEYIFDDMFCKYFDYRYENGMSAYHACLEIQKEFTITRKR